MAYYRQQLHRGDHTVSFIKQWGTGFGFLGKQGGESVHAEFNSLERVYNNVLNRVDHLYHMVREHLRLSLENLEAMPQPMKKRKLLD